ncbi:MAG: uracil-DNA glycosylase [Ruminococcaceae bacterium]|nr:uracil-DNA glycosylase [Oscillospiraceae bacterium]
MNQLDTLRQECLSCTRCGLCSGRTNVVFGVGNPQSDVLFIGEGPGQQEDLSGEPFVGRAGKLLDLMLDAVGLSRHSNIYIANIVKCRPPQNRDPLPEEQEECIKWLEEQIRIIKPRVIVCLGRIAAARIIHSDFKITKEHGQIFEKDGIKMMATLHPAALLRNPAQKPAAFEDFLKLRDLLAQPENPGN